MAVTDPLDVLAEGMKDPRWRLCNLYYILDKHGRRVKFKPNKAQLNLLDDMWYSNIVLKARQLGFTTFIQILIADRIFFSRNIRAGVIAHRREDCERILRDKIIYAYDNLPASVRDVLTVETVNKSELLLSNGSGVRVSTSMRSATLQILHISEFGKICAKNPHLAREIMTGTLPSVDAGNLIFIESTAEGAEGHFYRMSMDAIAVKEQAKELTLMDYKLHFYPWLDADEYQTDPRGVIIGEKDHDYFDQLEAQLNRRITLPQRAWWVKKRDALGADDLMWQEYPSTPEEAFKVSMEGCYYTKQLSACRQQNRVREHLPVVAAPVNTFWDLGADDSTGIWLHQQVGPEHRFIMYYEASGESLEHYVEWLQKHGHVYGTHYLPHDAAHKRLSDRGNRSIEEMLQDLGLRNTVIVPRVADVLTGIEDTRQALSHCWFDETGCKDGLRHLDLYRRKWDDNAGVWKSKPDHSEHSHCADAFRQFAQSHRDLLRQAHTANHRANGGRKRKARNWKTS